MFPSGDFVRVSASSSSIGGVPSIYAWLGAGVIAGYIITQRVHGPEGPPPALAPPDHPKYPHVDPKKVYSRAGTGVMEFRSFEDGGTDQWGTPIQYWKLPSGNKVRLFGDMNQHKMQRKPASLHPDNKRGQKGKKGKLPQKVLDGRVNNLKRNL